MLLIKDRLGFVFKPSMRTQDTFDGVYAKQNEPNKKG